MVRDLQHSKTHVEDFHQPAKIAGPAARGGRESHGPAPRGRARHAGLGAPRVRAGQRRRCDFVLFPDIEKRSLAPVYLCLRILKLRQLGNILLRQSGALTQTRESEL